MNDSKFLYYKKETNIGNGVWIGTNAVVNLDSKIEDYCVIGSNSVVGGNQELVRGGVYIGCPVELKYVRKNFSQELTVVGWFR